MLLRDHSMTPEQLAAFGDSISVRHDAFVAHIDQMDPAPVDVESTEHRADAFAEAIFLRAFTAYENDIEALFLHYVTRWSFSPGHRSQHLSSRQ